MINKIKKVIESNKKIDGAFIFLVNKDGSADAITNLCPHLLKKLVKYIGDKLLKEKLTKKK